MKWTVDEAKRFARKLGIEVDINEDNLEIVAKKIRKKLRDSGSSIKQEESKKSAPSKPIKKESHPEPKSSKTTWSAVLDDGDGYAANVVEFSSKERALAYAGEHGRDSWVVIKGTQMWNEPIGQIEEEQA